MKQLGILDSAFINLEQNNTPQHIGGFGIYDPSTCANKEVDITRLRETLERRLRKMDVFRTRLVEVPWGLDKPYWNTGMAFDSHYHLRHIALANPQDWHQLCEQIADIHAKPLDMSKPLWECYIIEGLNNIPGVPTGAFAIYTKMHHSLIDGSGSESFMSALHDLEANPHSHESQHDEVQLQPEADPSQSSAANPFSNLQLLSKAFINNSRAGMLLSKQSYKVASDLFQTAKKIQQQKLPPYPSNSPKRRFDQRVGPHRVFNAALFDLEDFKTIRRSTDATINDIAVAVVSGALREYLQHHDELLEESLIGTMPVNIRQQSDTNTDNNQISTIMAAIHTHIEDPLHRLSAICNSMNEAKAFIDTPLASPMKLAGVFPPGFSRAVSKWYVDKKMTRKLPLGTCGVITNVMGPPFPLYSAGAKMVQYHCLGLLTPGGALFHSVFSVDSKISISALSDRNIMPDPQFYQQCLINAFEHLKVAVDKQSARVKDAK